MAVEINDQVTPLNLEILKKLIRKTAPRKLRELEEEKK